MEKPIAMNKTMIISALLCSSTAYAYEITEPSRTVMSESQMRDRSGASPITFGKLNPNCEEECQKALYIDGYRHTFHHTAELQTVSRYKDRTFALVNQMHQKGSGKKSSRDDYHFISGINNSFRTERGYLCESAQASGFSFKGELVCLEDEQLSIYTAHSERTIPLPVESSFGQINNNLAGTLSISFVDADSRTLYYANLHNLDKHGEKAWQSQPTRLHDRSDRRDVIATYPVNRANGLVAMYEYINPFNKGLTLYSFHGNTSYRRIITNSEQGNFGFSPEVFVYQDQYILTASESTGDDSQKTYQVDPATMKERETYANDMSSASELEFMAGYGLSNNFWHAKQSIGDNLETEYEIEDSLMHTLYFQARYSDTQLSLKYLTNEAKDSGPGGTSEAVSMLTGLVDFHGFFEGADTLRLKVDWTETNGIATYKTDDSSLCLASGCNVSTPFTTEYMNVETLVLSDGGNYMGISYSTWAMPTAIGFTRGSDSDHVVAAAFDKDYEQARLMFVVGSDEAAYGARYEVDYNRWFLRPNLGFGMVQHHISDDAKNAARGDKEGSIEGEYGFALTGGLDVGYIYQRRWRDSLGLGFSVQAGLRGRLDWTTDNFLMKSDADDLYFNYDRLDLMWGPYVQFNAIF